MVKIYIKSPQDENLSNLRVNTDKKEEQIFTEQTVCDKVKILESEPLPAFNFLDGSNAMPIETTPRNVIEASPLE